MPETEYLDELKLGQITGLSADAKMLIYLNPRIINDLSASIQNSRDLFTIVRVVNSPLTQEDRESLHPSLEG